MKKHHLIAFLAIIFFTGCKAKEIIIERVSVRDSIVIVKDTVVDYKIQYQSVVTVDSSYLSTDLASSRASIDKNGLLHHSIQNIGSVPSKIIYKKVVQKDSIPYKVEVVKEKIVKQPEIVYQHGFFFWSGLIFYVCFFVWLIFKLKKFVI